MASLSISILDSFLSGGRVGSSWRSSAKAELNASTRTLSRVAWAMRYFSVALRCRLRSCRLGCSGFEAWCMLLFTTSGCWSLFDSLTLNLWVVSLRGPDWPCPMILRGFFRLWLEWEEWNVGDRGLVISLLVDGSRGTWLWKREWTRWLRRARDEAQRLWLDFDAGIECLVRKRRRKVRARD